MKLKNDPKPCFCIQLHHPTKMLQLLGPNAKYYAPQTCDLPSN